MARLRILVIALLDNQRKNVQVQALDPVDATIWKELEIWSARFFLQLLPECERFVSSPCTRVAHWYKIGKLNQIIAWFSSAIQTENNQKTKPLALEYLPQMIAGSASRYVFAPDWEVRSHELQSKKGTWVPQELRLQRLAQPLALLDPPRTVSSHFFR